MVMLVTGATGRSGRWFLRELAAHHWAHTVRCIVRETSDTTRLDHRVLSLEMAVGDLRDVEFIAQCMRGVHTVIHIAGISHSPTIVRAAIDAGVKRVILVHTAGVYSKFKSAAAVYLRIEDEIRNAVVAAGAPLDYVIPRPTMIYGGSMDDHNMSVFIRLVDKLRVIPLVDGGRALLQPVRPEDLGAAYYGY